MSFRLENKPLDKDNGNIRLYCLHFWTKYLLKFKILIFCRRDDKALHELATEKMFPVRLSIIQIIFHVGLNITTSCI